MNTERINIREVANNRENKKSVEDRLDTLEVRACFNEVMRLIICNLIIVLYFKVFG